MADIGWMKFRSLLLLLCVLPMALAPAGCSTNPATGEASFTAFMSPDDEKQVGAEQHPTLVQQFGGAYRDPELQAYVDRVGLSLARQGELQDLHWSFTILDDDGINAFALPGGYVHVTRGLLALASNEAELAGVLGHEIGHVTARHAAQRYSTEQATSLGIGALGILGVLAGLPPMLGSLASSSLQTGAAVYLQSYSRDQELEADRLGVRYMSRAGYDPDAMVTFFRKLDAYTRLQASLVGDPAAADRFDIMASHPRTAERVQEAGVEANAHRLPGQRLDRQRFLQAIDGLLYGDAPAQGLRRGRDFLHPGLRIAFRVPDGFVLKNSPQQVVAIGPDGAVLAFDAEPRADVARAVPDMATYLTRVWAAKAQLAALQQFTVAGMPAAAAAARGKSGGSTVEIRLVAIRGGPDRIWRFAFISRPQATARLLDGFRATVESFHALSAEEAAALQPWRIRLASVNEGDTQEGLAARMVMPELRLETFRVLNGLAADAPLTPGETMKIVGE